MKANELRIGNYVNVPNKNQSPFRIDAFEYLGDGFGKLAMNSGDNTHPATWYLINVEPIPLTEEWLLKFGFVEERTPPLAEHGKFYSKFSYDCKYSFSYAEFRGDWGFYHSYTDAIKESENNKFDFISCGIKYVHQLQNLYFDLTGEELTLT